VEVVCFRGALGLGHNLAVSLLDISESGVRLVVRTQLTVGEEVELNISMPWFGRPVKRLGEVTWCLPRDGKHFSVGIRLQKDLGYGEFQQFAEGF
jgi:hypothetical protein